MIRAAGPDDVDRIAALEAEVLGSDAWSPALIGQGVHGLLPTVQHLVAEVGAVVVGYAVASIVADVAELQRLGVDPQHRRRGVASALVAQVCAEAGERGAQRVLVEVREDNAGAHQFYAARGFGELDRRERYYRDGAAAVILQRPISSEGAA